MCQAEFTRHRSDTRNVEHVSFDLQEGLARIEGKELRCAAAVLLAPAALGKRLAETFRATALKAGLSRS
jgi:hypothetical protein